jgi:hypothetical protein
MISMGPLLGQIAGIGAAIAPRPAASGFWSHQTPKRSYQVPSVVLTPIPDFSGLSYRSYTILLFLKEEKEERKKH